MVQTVQESSMTEEAIQEAITHFLDHYFSEEQEVAQHNLDFLDANGLTPPKTNYIKLRRFIVTAVNHLRSMDDELMVGLPIKMFVDVERLNEFYLAFSKKAKLSKVVYHRDFLPSVPEYQKLSDEVTITEGLKKRYLAVAKATENEMMAMEKPKNDKELKQLKSLKGRYVDAVHNHTKAKEKLVTLHKELQELESVMEQSFFTGYQEYIDSYSEALQEIINTKTYYFDKLLWYKAEQSTPIRKFFDTAQIKGGMNTRTFIEYYTRNIDAEKSRNSDWHRYLKEILKIVE